MLQQRINGHPPCQPDARREAHLTTVSQKIGRRAANLFYTRQHFCAEAVLLALNKGLNGSLSEHQAISLTTPFGEGIGNSGCICGALAGGIMAIGLFLQGTLPRAACRQTGAVLHTQFTARFRTTCCRVLSRKHKHDPSQRYQHCSKITATTAELAAELILARLPHLADEVDQHFLSQHDSRLGALIKRLSAIMRYYILRH